MGRIYFNVACKSQIWQKTLFQNSEIFGNSFIRNGIIYVNLPFIYKNPITLSLLKFVTLKFTMYILFFQTY